MKTVLDKFVSIMALVILFVPIIILSIAVYAFIGRPVLFKQQRPGLNGKPFMLYKFRTMNNAKNDQGELLPDADRLSRFGRLLRSSSLDELPTLFNVLKGDMSLVGPRPLLMQYLPLYSDEQARRNDVKPGITGWAQINGRNSVSWNEKFRLDVFYVDNQSFWLDLKIIIATFKKVLVREGISAENHATIDVFKGND